MTSEIVMIGAYAVVNLTRGTNGYALASEEATYS